MKACPAGLYKQDDAGNIHFDSAGCLSAAPVGCCAVTLFSNSGNIPQAPVLIFATANHDPQARISGLMFCFESPT